MTDLPAVLDWIRRLDGQASAFAEQRDAALAEVERLRAAQPAQADVGPVTRDVDVLLVGNVTFHDEISDDWLLLNAARNLAVLAKRGQERAEVAAADTTPDTSRVTFGTRHEGTGMVVLQHADLLGRVWGLDKFIDAEFHRGRADDPDRSGWSRAAHAALAEVREALNTAEAAGVDVNQEGRAYCREFAGHFDVPTWPIGQRAHHHLAREVQALVDQGLRGDDLNARVPYEVRDHRAPVEAEPLRWKKGFGPDEVEADTSSGDEAVEVTLAPGDITKARQLMDELPGALLMEYPDGPVLRFIPTAARTSEDGAA